MTYFCTSYRSKVTLALFPIDILSTVPKNCSSYSVAVCTTGGSGEYRGKIEIYATLTYFNDNG